MELKGFLGLSTPFTTLLTLNPLHGVERSILYAKVVEVDRLFTNPLHGVERWSMVSSPLAIHSLNPLHGVESLSRFVIASLIRAENPLHGVERNLVELPHPRAGAVQESITWS